MSVRVDLGGRRIIKNVEITFAISISFEFADKVTVGCAAVISEKMVIALQTPFHCQP